MASYVAYTPVGLIGNAMFNFDAFGLTNYRYTGVVSVAVSDAFTAAQFQANPAGISRDVYTSLPSGAGNWSSAQLDNITLITTTYSSFINLAFTAVSNQSGANPAAVGSAADIDISLIYRTDLAFSGESALNTDNSFRYAGSRGDIVLNINGFGSSGLGNDYTLGANTFGFHVLMHEIGHSLGLSHPHLSITNGVARLTTDFSALVGAGFDKLGFRITSAADMNKEYFSIMSYDDQVPTGSADTFAQTPMILDVIALQGAYGEGPGSSGSANDRITPGAGGAVNSFRTYFDTGGNDTIDLVNYTSGAYLHMGTTIAGATHLVGVSMSAADLTAMVNTGSPASLRWFYGEFENASGSAGADLIIGNSLNNVIAGLGGNDSIDGGAGTDTAVYSGARAGYRITPSGTGFTVANPGGTDGTDSLFNIERLQFADGKLALDLSVSQSGGEAALLLGAVLPGRLALDAGKQALMGTVIGLLDAGFSLQSLADALLRLDVWTVLAGGQDHTSIARYLITNVNNGVAPDAISLTAAVNLIDTQAVPGTWLADLALGSSNQSHVGLVGLAQTGLAYL